jgi:hypothetical protein
MKRCRGTALLIRLIVGRCRKEVFNTAVTLATGN